MPYVLLICVLGVLPLGCGGPSGPELPDRYPVSGTVKLDGQPLEQGWISFESTDDIAAGNSPSASEIKNGQYELQATVGKKKVVITSPQEFGEADDTGVKATRETIPPRYNTKSTLEVEVKADAENVSNFDDLTSK